MLVKCGKCKDEITSKHRHDWVCCSCWNNEEGIYIDGGHEYTRLGGDLDLLTWWHEESKTWRKLKDIGTQEEHENI